MLRALATAFALVVAPQALAQSDFAKVEALYSHGTKPDLAEFAQQAAWAGRTVTPEGGTYGGGFFVYPDSDPLGNGGIYGLERVDANPDAFLTAADDQIDAAYQNSEFDISRSAYSPLADTLDPINPELSYSSGNGAVHFGVRKATTDQGVPLYLIAGTCASPSGCRSVSGYQVPAGQLLGIVYVWQNRMAVLPPPAPVPPPAL